MLSPVFTEYQGKRFVFFSSPHSDNGCLSNWYESRFSLDAHEFESAEQAFLYLKALSSHDEATALRVFAMNEPHYFARLNKQIRPFDARRWAERREAAMRQIVHEKFVQSQELQDFLLATGDALIVNCSKNPLWSCGLQMAQVERLDVTRWMGQNLLGQILMDLRQELRPPEPEEEPEPDDTPATDEETAKNEASSGDEGDRPDEGATEEPSPDTTPNTAEPEDAPQEPPSVTPDDDTSEKPAVEASEASAGQTDQTSAEHAPADENPAASAPGTEAEADETVLMPRPSEPGAAAETIVMPDAQRTELMSTVDVEHGEEATDQSQAEDTEGSAAKEERGEAGEASAADATSPVPQMTVPLPVVGGKGEASVVARYQEGDYPTADELADGSLLKGLMTSFTRQDSPAVRQALMQCLRDSVVAVTAVKVDPVIAATAPVRDDGMTDPLIMDNGSTYRPSILENDAGQRWFPAFSSTSEISDQISGQTSVIMLPMSKCVDLARTHGGLSGIVVNVFTDNLILPGRTCDYIADLPSHIDA